MGRKLVCDVCGLDDELRAIITVSDSSDAAICTDCRKIQALREAGHTLFQPTEQYGQIQGDWIDYGEQYPSLTEVEYVSRYVSPLNVYFCNQVLTPDMALNLLRDLEQVPDAFDIPGVPTTLEYQVQVSWQGVPLYFVQSAAEEFLVPALGLYDEAGNRLPIPEK